MAGPITRLLTRQIYFNIEAGSLWDSVVHFTPALLEELKFWFVNVGCFNGYSTSSPPLSYTILFSDASELAFGGYGSLVSGMWTADIIGYSSTYRELKAIYYVCLSCVEQPRHKKVKTFTDNRAAAAIVSIGSTKLELQ